MDQLSDARKNLVLALVHCSLVLREGKARTGFGEDELESAPLRRFPRSGKENRSVDRTWFVTAQGNQAGHVVQHAQRVCVLGYCVKFNESAVAVSGLVSFRGGFTERT